MNKYKILSLLFAFLLVSCENNELTEIEQTQLNQQLIDVAKKGDEEALNTLLAKGADLNAQDKNGRTALIWAVKKKYIEEEYFEEEYLLKNTSLKKEYLEIVKVLVENGADLDIQDNEGKTALIWAVKKEYLEEGHFEEEYFLKIEKEYLEIVKLLVENGADLDIQDNEGKTALIWAVKKEYFKIVKLLVENRADLDIQDNEGKTALIWASIKENFKIVKLLVENGADLDIQDNEGKTALIWAVKKEYLEEGHFEEEYFLKIEKEYLEIVKLLVENGADLDIQDNEGKTALIWAVKKEYFKIVKLLVENRADLDIQDNEGKTALIWASIKENFKIVKLLVENGADLDIQDNYGRTFFGFARQNSNRPNQTALIGLLQKYGTGSNAFVEARQFLNQQLLDVAKKGDKKALYTLIENGADLNIKDNEGRTALIWASIKENFEIVKLLVENGADLDIKDNEGKTALIWASIKENFKIVKFLVENGADLDIQDNSGRTFFRIAIQISSPNKNNYIDLIKKHGVGSQVFIEVKQFQLSQQLIDATKEGDKEALNTLLVKGADLNIKDNEGKTALIWAVEKENLEIVQILVGNKADLNIQDDSGRTALIWAVKKENLEIVQILVENGADLNIQDNYYNWTALIWAVEKENLEIVEFLVENEADLNIQDVYGWTALMMAVKKENFEIVQILVENGADVNIQNNYGKTALALIPWRWNLAFYTNKKAIVKLLKKHGAKK